MKRIIFILLAALMLCIQTSASAVDAGADSSFSIGEFEEYIPEEARGSLPDELFEADTVSDTASVFSFSYFFGLVRDAFTGAIGDNVIGLASLAGIVIVSSVFHSLAGASKSGELGNAFSSVSGLCVCVYVFASVSLMFKQVSVYLNSLASFASAVTPFITIAYAAGGNVGTATVSSTGLLVCITVIENVAAYALYPLLKTSAVLTIASSASPKLRIGTLSGFLRGVLMLLISLTVAAISAIMTFQHTLATAADSLGARAVRFAASSFIPIVGSAISEAVRTVSSSISYLRSTAGSIGIVVIVIITLPTFISLMLSRINLALSASLADMLGCERECKALKEAGGLINFLIALVSLMAVMFIYSLTLLVRCASSYG